MSHPLADAERELLTAARDVRSAFNDWGLEGYYDFDAMVKMERSRKAALVRLESAITGLEDVFRAGVDGLLKQAAESAKMREVNHA